MVTNLYLHVCKLLFFFGRLALSNHCSEHFHGNHGGAIFVFGDSLFDPGNNNYINTTTEFQANFLPYGETFFKYPTGRFSDGRLIPDFIAEYAKLPIIPAYLQPSHTHFEYGSNFASGGAGALVGTYPGLVIDLHTQLRYFKNVEKNLKKKLGEKEAKKLLTKAIYLFSVGGNDYLSTDHIQSSQNYVDMAIANLTSVVREIYKIGGRKFGFAGLGQIACIPNRRASNDGECDKELIDLENMHNAALSDGLKELESQLQGFKYSNFNFLQATNEVIDNPRNFGFKDSKTACCGGGSFRGVYSCGGKRQTKKFELCSNPAEYLYFDSYHPSEAAYRHFAEQMWQGAPNISAPYNIKSLFEIDT